MESITTSVFGDALAPLDGAPAAWITGEVTPVRAGKAGKERGSEHRIECECAQNVAGIICAGYYPVNLQIVAGPYSESKWRVNESPGVGSVRRGRLAINRVSLIAPGDRAI